MKRNGVKGLAVLLATLCLAGCSGKKVMAIPEETAVVPTEGESQAAYQAYSLGNGSTPQLMHQEYANVPGTPTQDAVQAYNLIFREGTEEEEESPVAVREPDKLIVAALADIYRFVREEDRMPVRYFPEDVQKQVQEILGGEQVDVVDILHMTEFFGIAMEEPLPQEEALLVRVQLEAEYAPGQLVVVMFGNTSQADPQKPDKAALENILWTPLPAKVTALGEISFQIPPEQIAELEGQDSLFLILTNRLGGTDGEGDQGQPTDDQDFIPSKDSRDMTSGYDTITSADGTALPDEFQIFLREHTQLSQKELERMQQFLEQEGKPIAAYFEETLQKEMALLLKQTRVEDLICYNASYLGAEKYRETYGDVIAGFRFAVPYPEGTEVVCLLGTQKEILPTNPSTEQILPEETGFDWAVLRGEVQDGYVFLTFSQQSLPIIQRQGALALILSQPMTGEDTP